MNRIFGTKRSGSATAMVLFAILVLSIMGMGLLTLGHHSRLFAVSTSLDVEARNAADAGLTKAIFEMNEKLKVKPWGGVLSSATDEALPYCNATFSYKVTGNPKSGYSVESVGRAGRSVKRVSCSLPLQSPFEYAIFARNILVNTDSTVDQYNCVSCGRNLKIGTNSTATASIQLPKGVFVDGDVFVGVGGDPDVAIDPKDQAIITGMTGALSEAYELQQMTVPPVLQNMASKGQLKDSVTLIGGAVKYDSVTIGKGKVIRINGPVNLYVIGSMNLSNNARLEIGDPNTNPNASLTLYLGGGLYTKTGGGFYNFSNDSKKLKIYGLDSCRQIIFGTTGTFYGAIYARRADVVLRNAIEIFGAVASEGFNQSVSANFHYDASLRDASVNDDGVQFVASRWYEQ